MHPTVNNINAKDLMNIYPDCRIIDVRPPHEYRQNHIPKSINIQDFVLMKSPNTYLNKSETYYLICNTGKASYRTCYCLMQLGFNLINVVDGIINWKGPLVSSAN